MATIKDSNDLLSYLAAQSGSRKDWFGYPQQRVTAVALAHEIAANHADKMSPQEIVRYVRELNQEIFDKIIEIRK